MTVRINLLKTCLSVDLDMFSTEERVSVEVKEGQGLLLLCEPPQHFPGN